MIITRGMQPATGALLSIQSITSFASLIRSSTHVESSLQSRNLPTLAAIAWEINNNYSNNRHDGICNRDFTSDYFKQHAVSYVEPPAKPAIAASQSDSSQLDYAHSLAHTAIVKPMHHVAPAR